LLHHYDLPHLDRRTLLRQMLAAGLAVGGVALIGPSPARAAFKAFPFSLGVASGDPAPDGFVIWTRLAPEPLDARGGMSAAPVEVEWEIANDHAMTRVVRRGTTIARLELAHSVRVEIEGLEPARDYFYRFRAGGAESAVGRARTLPAPGAPVTELHFAHAGCQRWEDGYYTAWRAIADEAFDFIFHYGDYIYENRHRKVDRHNKPVARTLPEDFPTCYTLTDYRLRYAYYKTDPDLQAAHRACPFLPSFDDHEVRDNWAGDTDPRDTPPEAFLFRRAAAFQAWYEHMPVRRALLPRGPDLLAYRTFAIGNLAQLAVFDTRQYRSKQACGDGFKACAEAAAPGRTMMGDRQERWFAERLRASKAVWQVLAQQVLFSHVDWRSFPWVKEQEQQAINLDSWDGASAGRGRVLSMLRQAKVANPVVLSGDIHMAFALDIQDDRHARSVGVEFVATSISSGGDGSLHPPNVEALRANNPTLKFAGNERGYTRHRVTAKEWRADYRAFERISTPGAPALTRKSFVVEAGRPRLVEA
jgi:alkaline phosphatase D